MDTHTTLDVKIAQSKMSVFKDSVTLDSKAFHQQDRWNIYNYSKTKAVNAAKSVFSVNKFRIMLFTQKKRL